MIFVWSEDDIRLYDRSYMVGAKLIGMQYNGKRPEYVELNYADLIELINHPEYLKSIQRALKYTS